MVGSYIRLEFMNNKCTYDTVESPVRAMPSQPELGLSLLSHALQ